MDTSRHILRKVRAVTAMLQGRRGISLVCGLAIGILIAGCGGSSNPPPATNAPAATNPPAAAQNTPTPTIDLGPLLGNLADPSLSETNLPGKDEFGFDLEQLVPMGEQVEVLIAECMNEAGFEYVAVDWDTIRAGMSADKHLPGLEDEDEYVKVHGFGISTLYTGGPPQLHEFAVPARVALGEQNIEIFKNLPPADQVAYNRTLFGERKDMSFAKALEFEDFSETDGCTRGAVEEVFGADLMRPGLANSLDFIINSDPRMEDARAAYSDCVAEQGYDYTHPEQVDSFLRDSLAEITGGQPVEQLSDEAKAALADLQEIEKKLGPVSHFCEIELYDPVADQIQSELYTGVQR